MNQLLIAAIAAYVIFSPTVSLTPDLQWHDEQRLAQIALLVVFAANAVPGIMRPHPFLVAPGQGFLPGRVMLALAAALSLGALSCALAPLPRWAFIEWSMTVLLIALVVNVALIRYRLGARLDRVLIGVLAFTATAYLLKVFAAYTAAIVERLPMHIWLLLDGFSNPRFFGHFQAMTLPLLIIPAMHWARTTLSRVGLALLPALWWMLAIASGTRGTWLAMAVASAVVFVCVRHAGYRWLKWQLGTFLAGIGAYGVFFYVVPKLMSAQIGTVNRFSEIASLSLRDVIWAKALEYIGAHPFLGIGPMHFAYYPNPVAAHPHMSLLQWAAEWGLPSAFLVLAIVVYAGMSYVHQLRIVSSESETEAYTLRLALLASLCAAAAQSLVDGVLVMPYSQTLLAVIGGWTLAVYISGSSLTHPFSRTTDSICRVTVLFSTVLLLWGIYPEIHDIAHRAGLFNTHHFQEGELLLPRFWSHGWIHP